MENSEIKNKNQIAFFNIIKKSFSENTTLANSVSDELGVGSDAAYRRIRGEKPLSFEETIKLCKRFKISFDMLIEGKNISLFDCVYRPINLSIPNEYQNYILALLNSFGKIKTAGNPSVLMSAIDIPVFHLMFHKELIIFKLYTWAHSVYSYNGSLEDFIKEIETPEIISHYRKISGNYEHIPSSEIWTENTINSTLRLINYYFEIKMFPNKEYPLSLCKHVLDILDKLKDWTENGSKNDRKTPFQLYLSEIDFECSYVLIKHSGQSSCAIRLFGLNGLNVLDKEFCTEAENHLTKLSKRSTLLCGNSEKERFKFFSSQQQKVQSLIEKIESGV